MQARRVQPQLTFNGHSVTVYMQDYLSNFNYTDNASGETDSIDITLNDADVGANSKWINGWLPQKNDKIKATIAVTDWKGAGDNRNLKCGTFILDDLSFSGYPIACKISAVAVPANSAFRETERTQTWEDVTIKEIAKRISTRAGIGLYFDAKAAWKIKSLEQSKKTDCSFLTDLCDKYGLSMKVYNEKIVIFDREVYKKKPQACAVSPTDFESWNWKTTLAGTYTGGVITYTDPKTEKDVTFKVGKGPRILSMNEKVESAADAERTLRAAINKANHGSTTLTVTLCGEVHFVAGQCVRVKNLGRLSGKYYVDTVTHNCDTGSGYKITLDMSLVETPVA